MFAMEKRHKADCRCPAASVRYSTSYFYGICAINTEPGLLPPGAGSHCRFPASGREADHVTNPCLAAVAGLSGVETGHVRLVLLVAILYAALPLSSHALDRAAADAEEPQLPG